MNRFLMTLAMGATLVSCGKSDDTQKPDKQPVEKPTAPQANDMAAGSTSKGANLCIKCNLRTDADTCPTCNETLKVRMVSKPPGSTHAPGTVGATSVAPMWVCPEPKCTVSFPTEVNCAKHKDTSLVEQWYTCAKCSSEEPVPGNCSGCGAALKGTVER